MLAPTARCALHAASAGRSGAARREPLRALGDRLRRALIGLLLALLGGCAHLPDVSGRPPSMTLPATAQTELGRTAAASVEAGGPSGFRLMAPAVDSLQARLFLIERAQVSLDLQYFQFKGDSTGRLLMRALRDAGRRGVRVRLLVDDLFTAGDDELLLGLAAQPNVEVRLFNPFFRARQNAFTRIAGSLFDLGRMQRRMHNKLFVADGVFAVAGGRNIGDEYFLRGDGEGFIDFDVLLAGAVVPGLGAAFDPYWNSRYAHSVQSVIDDDRPPQRLRQLFDEAVDAGCAAPSCDPAALPVADAASGPLRAEMAAGRIGMHAAASVSVADPPEKVDTLHDADADAAPETAAAVRASVAAALRQAREEMVIVSPYLIPGRRGIEGMNAIAQRGVRVELMTNSLATTDEPLAHAGYRPYRAEILRAGVALYEWSPARSSRVLRDLLGGRPVLRLHAKCAVIDRRLVYLGSMNFDMRSRDVNTEFGLLIDSPALAAEMLALIERMKRDGSHQLQLAADGETLLWVGGDERALVDPGASLWTRFLLDLLAPFVPEEML